MNVTLEPHQEQAIAAAIRAGRFRSLEELIESAVQTLVPPPPSPSTDPSGACAMLQVDGLWVHSGQPEPGADWHAALNDAREERLSEFWKPSHP